MTADKVRSYDSLSVGSSGARDEPKVVSAQSLAMTDTTSSKLSLYLIYIVFIASVGPLQFGYHLGELNAPQDVITCHTRQVAPKIHEFPRCIPMNPSQWGLVQSIFTIGGFIGALTSGPFANRYGRLLAMRASTAAFIVGPLACALATNIPVMTFGRFMSGIGAGASTVICPLYIAEVSPPDKRGLFGSFTQLMVNAGILVAQVLGYFLSHDSLWRIILATAALLGAVELLGLFFAPESPKWLAEHGHQALALQTLRRIRGSDEVVLEVAGWNCGDDAEQEPLLARSRTTSIKSAQQAHVSLVEALGNPTYRRAVIAVVAVMLAQQATGINSVVMYSVEILGAVVPSSASLITVLVTGLNVLVTLMCAPLADKIGRKRCLLLSISGMGIGSFLLAWGLMYDVPILSVVATFLFVASFGVGLGPVPFILASELGAPEAVGAIQSWGLAACWFAAFGVAQFFPMLNSALPNGKVFWIFFAVAVTHGAFIAWWIPETKGTSSAAEAWGDE